MSELTAEQNLRLAQMESEEVYQDEWQELCRAVIVRAVMDYATYGYTNDSRSEKKLHDDAKYWLFTDSIEITPYAIGADVSIGLIRQLARKLRSQVISGEFKIQRDLVDTKTAGQLSMFDLWSNMNG